MGTGPKPPSEKKNSVWFGRAFSLEQDLPCVPSVFVVAVVIFIVHTQTTPSAAWPDYSACPRCLTWRGIDLHANVVVLAVV